MLRHSRWQVVAFVTVLLLFTVALPTPPAAQPASDGVPTYREAVIGRISRLNPLFATLNPVDRDITRLIFEGLVGTNAFGEPSPLLAESWVIGSGGLEYVFTLRPDVLWQDGTPFSAADVLFTMGLLRAPDFPGDPDLSAFWRTVETEQIGERLIRFRLTQPLSTFLDQLQIGILPEHALRGTTAAALASHPFNLTPIGTGPYQLEAIRADAAGTIRQVDLRVAPNYRARPEGAAGFTIERLRFALFATFEDALAALNAGETDGLAARTAAERRPLFELANSAPFLLQNQIENRLGVLIFNWQRAEFSEQRVRVALEQGLNRTSAIERTLVNRAIEADSPLMPLSWAYLNSLPWPPFDTSAARAQLERGLARLERISAGESEAAIDDAAQAPAEGAAEATPDPLAPPPPTQPSGLFAFTILVSDDPGLVALAGEIATQWAQLNLDVTVETADRAAFQARLDAGQFDAAIVEYALGPSADPDVYAFWHQGQYPDGENYGAVDDRRISELLERARREPYGPNRVLDYQAFQREFVERAIALPLYYPLFSYLTASRVAGVQLGFIGSPADRFRNIGEWSLTP
jgi:peptide/nickel transport system substrate-binding protein